MKVTFKGLIYIQTKRNTINSNTDPRISLLIEKFLASYFPVVLDYLNAVTIGFDVKKKK